MIKSKTYKAWISTGFIVIVVALAEPAWGCGWWGDGEMQTHNQSSDAAVEPLPTTLNMQSARLPGRLGYGVAVPDPGRVVPYLKATAGRPITRIGELKMFGFLTVIDLGPSPDTARLHLAETESVGMRYVSIPIKDGMPERKQTERFARTIIDGGTPLMIYAPRAALLGVMWASYRLWLGSPLSYAIKEGRDLGLTPGQAAKLLE